MARAIRCQDSREAAEWRRVDQKHEEVDKRNGDRFDDDEDDGQSEVTTEVRNSTFVPRGRDARLEGRGARPRRRDVTDMVRLPGHDHAKPYSSYYRYEKVAPVVLSQLCHVRTYPHLCLVRSFHAKVTRRALLEEVEVSIPWAFYWLISTLILDGE